jgi:DeoR/GlpR family transcriptional regulator of sugar metabolism
MPGKKRGKQAPPMARLRRRDLEEYLLAHVGEKLQIGEVAGALRIDRTRLRRHLRSFAVKGLVILEWGSVKPISRAERVLEDLCPKRFAQRFVRAWRENAGLADAAVEIIAAASEGASTEVSLFLDVGTSCLAIAAALVERNLPVAVWTPNLPAAVLLLQRGAGSGRVTVIGGEAEGESVGVKNDQWHTSYDYALVSVYRVTPLGLWLRSSDYTAQKRRVMGLSGDGREGAADSVLVVASSDRLKTHSRGAADQPLATFTELREATPASVDRRYMLLVGKPDETNKATCQVLDLIRRENQGLQVVAVQTTGSLKLG